MNEASFKFNKSFSELGTKELLELEFDDLPAFLEHNGIKQIFRAKNQAYQFDVLDDEWQLGVNDTIYLNWMRSGDFSVILVLMFRLAFARQAESSATATIKVRSRELKKIEFSLSDPQVFQASYHLTSNNTKHIIFSFFKKISSDDSPRYNFLQVFFAEVISFLTEMAAPDQGTKGQNILDPVKGMYSEAESLEINNKLRLQISFALTECRNDDSFVGDWKLNQLGTVIAVGLMKSIFRRPTQLVQLKWNDVLPVGISFGSHRKVKPNEIPSEEYLFSDVSELHIRTFRGKDGEFRKQVERRSHRIDADFSNIILQYRMLYQRRLEASLDVQNIVLSKEEVADIMFQLPIFSHVELFSTDFGSKAVLFRSAGYHSEAFHKTAGALATNIVSLSKLLNLITDRSSKALTLSNNRFRHTVLSNGAWANMDEIGLSKITGVTPRSVIPYIDLSTESRLQIDKAFAGKKVFEQFGRVTVAELLKSEQFKVTNEFGEDQGILHKVSDCSNCNAKLGRPIGCYGCDNFKPHVDGNHEANLDKAQNKLAFNREGSGSPITLRKLERSIVFIQATILMCNEYQNMQKEIANERN